MAKHLRNPEVGGWLLMIAAIGVAAGLIFWLQRGLTFGSDEFFWLQLGGLAELDYFLHPYGGHLIVFPFFLWRGMLELFGASFTAFTVVQVIGLSISATLLYIYARRRIGPILAVAPSVTLLFLGSSWTVLLQPMIGLQFLTALVPGLAAILMLERGDRRGDVTACALLCLALTGFTQALAFLVGAAIAIALGPNWKRRIWIVAVPLLAYGAWRQWASQYGATGIDLSNIPFLPAYFVDSLGVITASIFGLGRLAGPGQWTYLRLEGFHFFPFIGGIVITILELLTVAGLIWLMRRRGKIPRTFWPALGILITLWLEQGVVLAEGRTPSEIRYIYAGTLLLLMVAVELLRGVRTTRLTVGIALVLTCFAVIGNLARFREGRQILDDYQARAQTDMTVIQLAGQNADPAFTPNIDVPDLVPSGLTLNTGPWLLVTERYGSSAHSIPELRQQSELVREEADGVAVAALKLRITQALNAKAKRCRRINPTLGATYVTLPRGGAVLRTANDSEVTLRRWADRFRVVVGRAKASQPVRLRIPTDESDQPWRLRFEQGGLVKVCQID